MTNPITDMDLPDEVANAARDAFEELDGPLLYGYKAAIRAALQALVDCGRAKVGDLDTGWGSAEGPWAPFAGKACLILRLDSDKRKPEEQR